MSEDQLRKVALRELRSAPLPDDARLQDLDISTRARNLVANAELETVRQLRCTPNEALLNYGNAGVNTVRELRLLVPFSPDGSLTYGELVAENDRLHEEVRRLKKKLARIHEIATNLANSSESSKG